MQHDLTLNNCRSRDVIERSLLSFHISRHNGRCTPEITMVLLRTEDSDLLTRDAMSMDGVSSRSDV